MTTPKVNRSAAEAKTSARTFWGVVLDRLVKASLIGFTLTGIVGELLRLLVAYKVVSL